MTMLLSNHDISAVKRELGHLLPQVKSSHRVEAMARGLGFQTNAALLARLNAGPAECQADDEIFTHYLVSHGFEKPATPALTDAVTRAKYGDAYTAIAAVMQQWPELNTFGFGVFDIKQAPAQRKAVFDRDRADMLSPRSIEHFKLAIEYLSTRSKRTTMNRNSSSYGLKHQAEQYLNDLGVDNGYITNGMFIAAAAHLGFKLERRGPNAYLNISDRPGGATPTPLASGGNRKTAWRNMMVAAINAGLEQKIFGLGENDNHWQGDGQIYYFTIGGLRAIAYVTDISFGELAIHVAVNPSKDAAEWIDVSNAGFEAGEAFAAGWLERKTGKWLQVGSGKPICQIRRHLLPTLTDLKIAPSGYGDNGKFFM